MKTLDRRIVKIACAHALGIGLLIAPPAGAQSDLVQKPDAGSAVTDSNRGYGFGGVRAETDQSNLHVPPAGVVRGSNSDEREKGGTSERVAGKGIKTKSHSLTTLREAASGMPALDEGTEAASPEAARGIEKKDIRRGMVIAKPGSITPHTRTTSDGPPANTLPPQSQEITIKEKSSHVRTKPNNAAQ